MGGVGNRSQVLARFAESVSPEEARLLSRALQAAAEAGTAREPRRNCGASGGLVSHAARPRRFPARRRPLGRARAARGRLSLAMRRTGRPDLGHRRPGCALAGSRYRAGFVGGTRQLIEGLFSAHPLQGLGLYDALGLTLAADLVIVLCAVLGVVTMRTVEIAGTASKAARSGQLQGSRVPGNGVSGRPASGRILPPGTASEDRAERRNARTPRRVTSYGR